ncbi:MAG: hypothetical protein ACKOHG_05120, partial [Planctomycetia bacterium]
MTRFSPQPADDGCDDGRFAAASTPETHDPLHEALFPDGLPLGEPIADELAAHDAQSGDRDAAGTAADGYWQLSRTPLTSLVFTLPLVLAYEGGVLVMGRGSPRNGADVWLRHLLDALGFGQYFLLPALTIVGLLAWHHVAHDRWQVRAGVLAGMALECVIWAAVLVG